MAVISRHDFTGADGAELTTLTPTTGAACTKVSGFDFLVQSNRLYAGGTNFYATANTPTYPYRVRAQFRCITILENQKTGIWPQGSTTQKAFYVWWNAGSNLASVRLNSPSTTHFFTAAAGTDYILEVVLHSATVATCYLDGAMMFGGPIGYSTLGTPLVPRFRNEDVASTTTTGVHFDWLEVEDLTAPEPFKYRTIAQGLATRIEEEEQTTLSRRAISGLQLGAFVLLEAPLRPLLKFFGLDSRRDEEEESAIRRASKFLFYRPVQDITPPPPATGGSVSQRIWWFLRRWRR